MSLGQKRQRLENIEIRTGQIFSKIPVSPNQYTLISLILAFLAFYSLVKAEFITSVVFYIMAAFLDFVDGAVARTTGKASKIGAYLDTICDRYVEALILLGFLFLPLPKIVLEANIWIFLALFGSLMTTYAKASAKEKDLIQQELKNGWLGRAERAVLISFSLILGIFNPNFAIYPIIILAFFSNVTAFQRIYSAIKAQKV